MRVRCISDSVTPEDNVAIGRHQLPSIRDKRLSIGKEYLVLGLSFEFDPAHLTSGPYVFILLDKGNVAYFDLALFEVSDPRVSRYWQIRKVEFDSRQVVDILPPALFDQLNDPADDERSLDERDSAYFEMLQSQGFRDLSTLLQSEFASSDHSS